MKRLTILKTVAFFIGWLILIQLLPVGLHIMNKPSIIYFTLGVIFEVAVVCAGFYLSGKLGDLIYKLTQESKQSRLDKLSEQFKKDNEI